MEIKNGLGKIRARFFYDLRKQLFDYVYAVLLAEFGKFAVFNELVDCVIDDFNSLGIFKSEADCVFLALKACTFENHEVAVVCIFVDNCLGKC